MSQATPPRFHTADASTMTGSPEWTCRWKDSEFAAARAHTLMRMSTTGTARPHWVVAETTYLCQERLRRDEFE
jgi:hypothetical protein